MTSRDASGEHRPRSGEGTDTDHGSTDRPTPDSVPTARSEDQPVRSDALTVDADSELDFPADYRRPPKVDEGDTLGSYRLERKLGAGGMGDVFAARPVDGGDPVALKLLSTTTATRLYRFKREFRALADISHRNLIRLYELVVPQEGPPFFTMELLDGLPFVEWVRGELPTGEAPDFERLEDGLRQLIEGVHYLHSRDYIHRDIKPANVLVTREGRVVVLDFGLVSELSSTDHGGVTRDRQIVGTPTFMAPEQAMGGRVGAAADYYSIGMMLFESLTGRLPHDGPAIQQLLAKQGAPPDPGDKVAGLPDWVRTLCIRLLARDPEARPGGRELLEILQASSSDDKKDPATIFVGRQRELTQLHGALERVTAHRTPQVVHLRGRSGDGKSALVRRFRSELAQTSAVVLHGRCRERETVPYKGVDAIVDALSAYLRWLSEDDRELLRPTDIDALVRLFPVLDDLWVTFEAQTLGMNEVRRLGTLTLRRLIEQLAEDQPLVIHIDDVQWADLDSISLLQAIVRPPEPPPVLLLLSYRRERDDLPVLQELRSSEVLFGPDAVSIELGALSTDDAQQLARQLLRAGSRVEPAPSRAETIALRSRGSPFFIAQMALGGGTVDPHESNLDQIMVRRLSDLDEDSRRLLEVVAVFGGPLSTELVLQLSAPSTPSTLDALCEQGLLVRDEGDGAAARIETAHDRVREVALEELSTDQRVALHRTIGNHLLEHHDGDPPGDDIFAVVNQLDAGMGDISALSPERRQLLADLNHRAGQRAVDSGAWIAARRYLGHAYELAEPWLAEARQGPDRAHYDLCVAVAFGRAQVEFSLEAEAGDEQIEELLGWSLSMVDYCRIAQWYCWNLSLRARLHHCVWFGLRALEHIGFPSPKRPSWIRAVMSYMRGWRSVWKVGPSNIRALPPIEDERTRAGMDILAAAEAYSTMVDLKLHLALAGVYGRLLPRHGFHDGAGVALSALAMSAAAQGKVEQAKELFTVVRSFADARELSTFAQYGPQAIVLSALNTVYPHAEVLSRGEEIYERAYKVAAQTLVETIGLTCVTNRYCASVGLPSLLEFVDTFEGRHDGFKLSWVGFLSSACRRYARALTQGRGDTASATSMVNQYEGPAELAEIVDGSVTVMQIEVALLLGETTYAWELTRSIAKTFERNIGTLWHAPMYCMLSVILMVDRSAEQGGKERRRLRRTMLKRRKVARKWAERCPDNYQPMLEIIDAELAGLDGKYDEAVSAFERARAMATEHGTARLIGLASERFGRLAQAREQSLVAEAAYDAARSAYHRWGATSVVRRLDEQRAAQKGD